MASAEELRRDREHLGDKLVRLGELRTAMDLAERLGSLEAHDHARSSKLARLGRGGELGGWGK